MFGSDRAEPMGFDAVLLDVGNGPHGLTRDVALVLGNGGADCVNDGGLHRLIALGARAFRLGTTLIAAGVESDIWVATTLAEF